MNTNLLPLDDRLSQVRNRLSETVVETLWVSKNSEWSVTLNADNLVYLNRYGFPVNYSRLSVKDLLENTLQNQKSQYYALNDAGLSLADLT